MLLSNTFEVIQSLLIKLTFEDGSVKRNQVDVGDTICVVYNKNGLRTTISSGIVKKIAVNTEKYTACECSFNKNAWYMIVDGCASGMSSAEKVIINNILDLDALRKQSNYELVTSPVGETNISNIRIHNNNLEYSTDGGVTWMVACATRAATEKEAELSDRIDSIIPKSIEGEDREGLKGAILALVQSQQ